METNEADDLEVVADGAWLTLQARAEAAKAIAAGQLPPPAIQTARSDEVIEIIA
jgi:hypothetical protein